VPVALGVVDVAVDVVVPVLDELVPASEVEASLEQPAPPSGASANGRAKRAKVAARTCMKVVSLKVLGLRASGPLGRVGDKETTTSPSGKEGGPYGCHRPDRWLEAQPHGRKAPMRGCGVLRDLRA
jgi:hypothetical protein